MVICDEQTLEHPLKELVAEVTNNHSLYPFFVLTYLPKLDVTREDEYVSCLNDFLLHTIEERQEFVGATKPEEVLSEGVDYLSYMISMLVYIRYVAACNSILLNTEIQPEELFFDPDCFNGDTYDYGELSLNCLIQMRRYHPIRKWHKLSTNRDMKDLGRILSMQYNLCFNALHCHVAFLCQINGNFSEDLLKTYPEVENALKQNLAKRIKTFEKQGLTIKRKNEILTAIKKLESSVPNLVEQKQLSLEPFTISFEPFTMAHPDAPMFVLALKSL